MRSGQRSLLGLVLIVLCVSSHAHAVETRVRTGAVLGSLAPATDSLANVDSLLAGMVDGGVAVRFGDGDHFTLHSRVRGASDSGADVLASARSADGWPWSSGSEDSSADGSEQSLGEFARSLRDPQAAARDDEAEVDALVRSTSDSRRLASAFFFGLFNGVMLGFGDHIRASIEDSVCEDSFAGVAAARATLVREVMRLFAGYGSESVRGGRGYARWTFHQLSVIAGAVVTLLAEAWRSARACEPLWKLLRTLLIVIIVVVVAIVALMVLAPWAMVIVQISGLVLTLGALVPFLSRQWRGYRDARDLPKGIARSEKKVEHITALVSGVIAALLFAGINKIVKLSGPRLGELLAKPALAVRFRLRWHPQLLADLKSFARMLGLCKRGAKQGGAAADDAARAVDDFVDDAGNGGGSGARDLPDDTVVPDGGTGTGPTRPKAPKLPDDGPKIDAGEGAGKKIVDDVVDPKGKTSGGDTVPEVAPKTPKQYDVDTIVEPNRIKPIPRPGSEDEAARAVSEARKALDGANDEYHIVKGHAMDFEKVSGLRRGKPDLSKDVWRDGYNRGVDKSGPLARTHSPSHAGNPWSQQVDDAFGNVEAAKVNLRDAQRYLDDIRKQAASKASVQVTDDIVRDHAAAKAALERARKSVDKAETDILTPKMEFKEATWNREAWGKKNPGRDNMWDEDVEVATKAYEAAKNKLAEAREALAKQEGIFQRLDEIVSKAN